MMKLQNPETRSNLRNRLRRIEGQVRGVEKMVEEDRQCDEIVQQLASIRSAVHSAMINFLQEHSHDCLYTPPGQDSRTQEQTMTDLISLLGKVN